MSVNDDRWNEKLFQKCTKNQQRDWKARAEYIADEVKALLHNDFNDGYIFGFEDGYNECMKKNKIKE